MIRPAERAAVWLFLLFVAVAALGRAVTAGLNHDEHQFIAPAALWARDGLLPYRDYPLFHLPNLVFIYGFLDGWTSWRLLPARIFNALCAWGTVALVFRHLHGLLRERKVSYRWAAAGGAAMLLLTCALFNDTAGKSWNHDAPALATVAALLLMVRALRTGEALALLASGLCVGLAIGLRLTFAPILAPFGLAVLFLPDFSWKRRALMATWFSLGAVLALSPSIYFALTAPEQFWFGNFEFPRLRLLDHTDERARKTAKLWRKLRFLFKEVAREDAPLTLAFLGVGLTGVYQQWRARTGRLPREAWLLGGVMLFLLAGTLSPTRYQFQHFYALAPLAALGAGYGAFWLRRPWPAMVFPMLVLISLAMSVREQARLFEAAQFAEWAPVKVHEIGRRIREVVPEGKVLTLAPIYPLEAGLEIYPAFATGPFAWRLAHLVKPAERERMGVIAPADLERLIAEDPPAALLLGAEDKRLEEPFRDLAKARGYSTIDLGRGLQLALPPAR